MAINQPLPNTPPPSREKLIAILNMDGADSIDLAQRLIDNHKLPYIIELGADLKGRLKDTLSAGELYLQQFITVDPSTLKMKDRARKMAKSKHEVLIVGDTGTGKELIAKSMIGDRKGAIKAINCAGLPRELIESELFGHVAGAFTGANKTKDGLMSAASDGVMFLDEIGELDITVQAKLLRALQEKKIRKVGSLVDEDITCKFVCATHRDLKGMVSRNEFRKDLYARISTLELDILPLVDRMCDIVPITASLPNGKNFLLKHEVSLNMGRLDLSLNVRSLQQHVIRFTDDEVVFVK